VFPIEFKLSRITPIKKQAGLKVDEPLNNRPIANLVNISKIPEKLYLSRLNEHISITNGNFDD